MGHEHVPRCQHVKVNGTQCGSPALRRKSYCFFHYRAQYERELAAHEFDEQPSKHTFGFALLEDANSIQVALMKTIQMLGAGTLDLRTAGLMLYALQTASNNLRHTNFEPAHRTEVVIDEDTVDLTRLFSPQWAPKHFKDERKAPDPPKDYLAETSLDKQNLDVAQRRAQKLKVPFAAPQDDENQEESLTQILLDKIAEQKRRDREERGESQEEES